MGLDRHDKEMMCISIPVVDYWEIREDLDRLEDAVSRLERIVEALILLHKEETVKGLTALFSEVLNQQKKGNRSVDRTG